MAKFPFITLISICTIACFSSTGQTVMARVDGMLLPQSHTYFNESIKKKESAANDYIGLYQAYLSGIRGQECPMYPSCSNYGLKTFSEKNFALGFIMTSDRLLRCGHDHKNYSLTLGKNGFKSLDYPSYDSPPLELYYIRNSYSFAYSDSLKDTCGFVLIKKLINNQYYQEALLEIMRLELLIDKFNIELFINKVICLKALEEYEKALFEYDNRCPNDYKTNPQLLYEIATINYKIQNYDKALGLSKIALISCMDTFLKPKIILLKGLVYANKYDWENAICAYDSLSTFDSYKQVSTINYKIAESGTLIKNKSPSIAGILSIVPGLGYAYTGHKQTTISALLVNGLLAYATYSNFKQGNIGMGVLTGVFNVSFYIGNIYGAIKSANRWNENQRKLIIKKLEFNSNL